MGSSVKLSVAIMGHPKRKHFIDELIAQLPPSCPVILDEKNDRWDTGSRALQAYDHRATHHVVVQDDAILCKDFIAGCEAVARAAGDRPVCLYIGQVRPHAQTVSPAVQHVLQTGGAWLSMPGPWWGVAVIMPTMHIDRLCEWGATRRHIMNYDKRMARWFYLEKIPCLYTVPSLVDHRPVNENPSLVAGRNGNRRAQVFIGEQSPLDIDWNIEPTPLKTTFKEIDKHQRTVRVHVGGVNYVRMKNNPHWEEVT